MQEFSRLFQNDATLYVPEVFAEFSTDSVITMEFIDGLKPDNPTMIEQQGISPADVAANGARVFMKQAFVLGTFHGDPHPGNVRVLADGSLCLLDYGMVGNLEDCLLYTSPSPRDQRGSRMPSSA